MIDFIVNCNSFHLLKLEHVFSFYYYIILCVFLLSFEIVFYGVNSLHIICLTLELFFQYAILYSFTPKFRELKVSAAVIHL